MSEAYGRTQRTRIPDPIDWYERNVGAVAAEYESVDPAVLNGWLAGLLPKAGGTVVDFGAGTGRDAA